MFGIGPFGIAFAHGGDDRPTVNIGAWSPSTIEEDESASCTITYNGTVTAYNLVSSEVEAINPATGNATTNTHTITVTNGTTSSATVTYNGSSGDNDIKIRILEGACQNGALNNKESALGPNLTVNEGK